MLQRISLSLALLLFFSAALVQAQTPASASNYFDHGTRRYQKGDLNGAIEDFTRAIEISSRLGPTKLVRGNSMRGASGFSDSDSVSEASSITVIDPLTAHALTSRGLARFDKGDIDGAHRRLFAHIEARSIGALPRHLAVGTGMLAPQGHDEEMKWGGVAKEGHAAA